MAYVDYTYLRTVKYLRPVIYGALILGFLTIAYIIMTMHVFSRPMNIAGGDSRG